MNKVQRHEFVEKFPTLARLLREGVVDLNGGEYIGLAADGTLVNLGHVTNPAGIERYLTANPTPDKW